MYVAPARLSGKYDPITSTMSFAEAICSMVSGGIRGTAEVSSEEEALSSAVGNEKGDLQRRPGFGIRYGNARPNSRIMATCSTPGMERERNGDRERKRWRQ